MATKIKTTLPDTLAQRVQVLRVKRQLTTAKMAEKALLEKDFIEEVEAGIQLFLSPVERQRMARVLKVDMRVLQEVEKSPEETGKSKDDDKPADDDYTILLFKIMQNPDAEYDCPKCQKPLVVRLFSRLDMNDDPVQALKIHCSQCLFRLSRD